MLPLPAAAVTAPPVQVPVTAAPLATRPAGSVSVKVNVCVGLPVGCVTVKVRFVLPPTVRSALKTLLTVGTAATTVTQAPALGVTPLVALGVMDAVMLVVVLMLLLVLAFGASVHAPTVGAATVVIGTMMVQIVAGFTT